MLNNIATMLQRRKEMAKKKMHVGFVLDESGSMMSVKSETISGFNEYVDTLREDKKSKNMLFTLTKFNSGKVDVVCNGVDLKKVEKLNNDTYLPDNLTPLYDAIGGTIRSLESCVKSKDTAIVVIQTDGAENMSKEFTQKGIFALIEEKKNDGWTFAFLGADQDAWAASRSLGIAKGNTVSYNSADTERTFRSVATASVSYAQSGGNQTNSLFDEENK